VLFNSYIFLVFLILVIPTYYFLNSKWRKILILVGSYFFYGYWDYRFCSLLLISTVIDFYTGKYLFITDNLKKRRILLSISLISNLGILGFFKYFNFFIHSFEAAFSNLGLQLDFLHLNIILPVGISFYTFQTLTYTIDIYRKEIKPTKNFIDFANYVAFFPQLVAGPIERAKHLLPQVAALPTPTLEQFKQGFVLITIGMFKKVLIGDTTGRIVDQIFAQPQYYASSELLMGLILFSIQIYADFSGYSSIARGTAKWLGIDLMENFNQPYLSANITEFWRRWHISLSSWLRDYLYIPLGGNRKGVSRTYINLMITMLLGGLWHGANWTFVVWGGLHGLFLSVHKFFLKDRKISDRYSFSNSKGLVAFLLKVVLTNFLVLITWLFFRAKSFNEAFYFLKRFFEWTSSSLDGRVLLIIFSFSFITVLIDVFEYYYGDHEFLLKFRKEYILGFSVVTWFVILLYMFQATPMPFIYFQF